MGDLDGTVYGVMAIAPTPLAPAPSCCLFNLNSNCMHRVLSVSELASLLRVSERVGHGRSSHATRNPCSARVSPSVGLADKVSAAPWEFLVRSRQRCPSSAWE